MGGELTSPANVTGVRIQIGGTLKYYPDGGLMYDDESGAWLVPLTEEISRAWPGAVQLGAQVGVRQGSTEYHYCPTFAVTVGGNIIEEAWSDE